MTNAKRSYTRTQLGVLYASCGNLCAYPDCTNNIIEPGTDDADAVIAGHISHIYAAADNGPRGRPDLTEAERNAPDNLLLLCAHHHTIVDKQPASYPADTLKEWKRRHETKFQQGTAEALQRQKSIQQLAYVRSISDEEIDQQVARIRKGRYFGGFDAKSAARDLAIRVGDTELTGGSDEARARALAWCSRLLSTGESSQEAVELLRRSRDLVHASEDADLAEAFITANSDKQKALAKLQKLNSTNARSAAYRIVTNTGTADEAFARFALAFAKGDPRAAADHIAKHRDQLYRHLDRRSIQLIEIELLARSGQSAMANGKLDELHGEGLSAREEQSLRRLIAEFEGADAAAERRKQYEQTGDIRDLTNLADVLQEQGSWQELLPFAEALFAKTQAHEDAFRVAAALNETAQYGRLYAFLNEHPDLIEQSKALKTLRAWSLFREGRLEEATALRAQLAATRDDPNDRAFRLNIAIASGNWSDLVDYTTNEWENCENRTPAELLAAGQLAQAVNAPFARQLISAAAEKGNDDPEILTAAYFHSTSAGWEQTPLTSQWMARAAALSDPASGPLQTVSLKELLERKPDWDKHENSVWKQLNEGAIPMFGAAHMLRRSVIDFALLQSIGNMSEPDVRKRGIVYGYSGARGFTSPSRT